MNKINLYGGIDPGTTGGYAILNSSGQCQCLGRFENWKMVRDLLESSKGKYYTVWGLEKVHGFPGMAVPAITSFMKNAGGWEASLEYSQSPYTLIPPRVWQRYILGSFGKGESKLRAFEYAKKRWPELELIKSHTGIIDALCMAEYVRQKQGT